MVLRYFMADGTYNITVIIHALCTSMVELLFVSIMKIISLQIQIFYKYGITINLIIIRVPVSF